MRNESGTAHDHCLSSAHRCVFRSLMIVSSAISWFVAGNTNAFSGKVAHVEGRRWVSFSPAAGRVVVALLGDVGPVIMLGSQRMTSLNNSISRAYDNLVHQRRMADRHSDFALLPPTLQGSRTCTSLGVNRQSRADRNGPLGYPKHERRYH